MRVLHFTPMYPSASNPGFGAFVKSQIDSLRNYVEIDVMVLPGLAGMLPYVKSIPAIRAKLRGDYDIIHIHFGHVSSLIKMVTSNKTPIVTSYCGTDLLGKVSNSYFELIKGRYLSILNIRYAKYDTCSIVKSVQLAAKLEGHSKNINIIPNGVDTNLFQESEKVKCRLKLGLPQKGNVILFPADPENQVKNFKLLQEALDEIKDLNIQVLSFDKNNRVAHEEVPIYINAADLTVLTSIHEGSSNVIKETMGCNGRVISTDVGDIKWLLEGVNNAAICSNNKDSLANLIRQNFSSWTDANNSREVLFKKNLDSKSIAEQIVKVYNQISQN